MQKYPTSSNDFRAWDFLPRKAADHDELTRPSEHSSGIDEHDSAVLSSSENLQFSGSAQVKSIIDPG